MRSLCHMTQNYALFPARIATRPFIKSCFSQAEVNVSALTLFLLILLYEARLSFGLKKCTKKWLLLSHPEFTHAQCILQLSHLNTSTAFPETLNGRIYGGRKTSVLSSNMILSKYRITILTG